MINEISAEHIEKGNRDHPNDENHEESKEPEIAIGEFGTYEFITKNKELLTATY